MTWFLRGVLWEAGKRLLRWALSVVTTMHKGNSK